MWFECIKCVNWGRQYWCYGFKSLLFVFLWTRVLLYDSIIYVGKFLPAVVARLETNPVVPVTTGAPIKVWKNVKLLVLCCFLIYKIFFNKIEINCNSFRAYNMKILTIVEAIKWEKKESIDILYWNHNLKYSNIYILSNICGIKVPIQWWKDVWHCMVCVMEKQII